MELKLSYSRYFGFQTKNWEGSKFSPFTPLSDLVSEQKKGKDENNEKIDVDSASPLKMNAMP